MNSATSQPAAGQGITSVEILDAARALGVLDGSSQAAPRILATLCQPGVAAREVAQVISQEPALTARVLRVANSAFYGVSRAIATVDRAVVVLGLNAVRGIAAAACLDRRFLSPAESAPVNMAELLRHCVATAVAAEALARLRARDLAPDAFIGGLLHDLGVVLQLRLDPAGVTALAAVAGQEPPANLPQLESRYTRVGHQVCAAVLFDAWHLPESLLAAAAYHHNAQAAPAVHRPLVALVQLGEYLSLCNGMGFGAEIQAGEPDAVAMAELNLSVDQLELVSGRLPRLVAELQSALAN